MQRFSEKQLTKYTATSWLEITITVAMSYWLFAIAADFLSLPGALTAIWPASGIAAFSILAFGFYALPGIILGVYLNQLSWIVRTGDDQLDASLWTQFIDQSQIGLSYAIGNALEAILMLCLIRHFCASGNPLHGSGNVIRFIALAALASPVIGAVAGVLVTCGIWGWTPWEDFWTLLWTWWVSAAAGILVVTPPLLLVFYERKWPWQDLTNPWYESTLLTSASCTVLIVAFYLNFPFEYLLLPILLWSAFRFGQCVTSWLGGIMMLTVVVITTHGHGPFSSVTSRLSGSIESLTLLQCFVATLIGTAMIVSAIVTERRLIAEELRKTNVTLEERVVARTHELSIARQAAEDANLAKSRFIAAASHDLRQPLYTLRIFVDALCFELRLRTQAQSDYRQDYVSMLNPSVTSPSVGLTLQKPENNGSLNSTKDIDQHKLRELTTRLSSTLSNLHDLFEKILDRSAQDIKDIEAHRTWIDIADLLNNIEQDIAPRVLDKGLQWNVDCCAASVRSDPVLLERIVRNLLDNAVKYTHEGSISVHGMLVGTALKLVICDTGPGIPAEHQRPVSNELNTSVPNEKTDRQDFGLGLSIVQRLCRLLRHELSIDSTEGRGTAVALRFTEIRHQSADEQDSITQPTKNSADVGVKTSRKFRVLIFDDSSANYQSIEKLVKDWGYDVIRMHMTANQKTVIPPQWIPDVLITSSINIVPPHLPHTAAVHTPVKTDLPLIILNDNQAQIESVNDEIERRENVLYINTPVKPAQLRSAIRSCLRGSQNSKTEDLCSEQ